MTNKKDTKKITQDELRAREKIAGRIDLNSIETGYNREDRIYHYGARHAVYQGAVKLNIKFDVNGDESYRCPCLDDDDD